MANNVTENDLILYCYEELDQERSSEIDQALQNDPQLQQQYNILKQTMRVLDLGKMSPSQTTVDIIREHSGHHSSLETS